MNNKELLEKLKTIKKEYAVDNWFERVIFNELGQLIDHLKQIEMTCRGCENLTCQKVDGYRVYLCRDKVIKISENPLETSEQLIRPKTCEKEIVGKNR